MANSKSGSQTNKDLLKASFIKIKPLTNDDLENPFLDVDEMRKHLFVQRMRSYLNNQREQKKWLQTFTKEDRRGSE